MSLFGHHPLTYHRGHLDQSRLVTDTNDGSAFCDLTELLLELDLAGVVFRLIEVGPDGVLEELPELALRQTKGLQFRDSLGDGHGRCEVDVGTLG